MFVNLCCCSTVKKLLFWNSGPFTPGSGLVDIQQVYADMGLDMDYSNGWSGNIGDYGLIIWSLPQLDGGATGSDPPWWGSISGGTWQGRLLLSTRNTIAAPFSVGYVNGKSGITGIGVTAGHIDQSAGCSGVGSVEVDALNAGMSQFMFFDACTLSGGTTLSKTATGAVPWLAHNTVGTIDFVVSGADAFLRDGCTEFANNVPFFENLWNVAV